MDINTYPVRKLIKAMLLIMTKDARGKLQLTDFDENKIQLKLCLFYTLSQNQQYRNFVYFTISCNVQPSHKSSPS